MYNVNKIIIIFLARVNNNHYLCNTNNNNNNSNSNMKKYSINPKLNKCLNGIEDSLLSMLDTEEECMQEIRRYVNEFKNEPDYNIAQYGNAICYYPELREFYRSCGYKTTDKMSNEKLWATYLHQVGYVARQLVRTSK